MSRELIASWLKQNIARYHNADRIYADVLAALDRYPSLRPKTDVYTFDDGRTQLLLCIHGLLPISYRGASYNIPIALWLVLSYPVEPPLVYVVPTSEMLVKPSAQVDHSGCCSIDYIVHWSRKPESCSLVSLLEAMQGHFSTEPPLYAKSRPKPSVGPSPVKSSITSSPPGAASPDRGHVSSEGDSDMPPRLPPKPFSPGPGRVATPANSYSILGPAPNLTTVPSASTQPSSSSTSQTRAPDYPPYATGTEIRDNVPPPVPPPPPERSSFPGAISSLASSPEPPYVQTQVIYGPPPYASAHPPVPPRPPVPAIPFAEQNQRPGVLSHTANGQPPVASARPAIQHAYSNPPAIPQHLQVSGSPPISAQYSSQGYAHTPGYQPPAPPVQAPSRPTPPDLLDSNDDINTMPAFKPASANVAPPRPPNPQTVALHNALLSSFYDALSRLATTHADALVRQRAAQGELLAGPEAIRDESARLVAVRDVCRVVGDRWSSLIADGERALGEMRRRGEVGVDEMVCASSIVGNQLVNLVAEDNAIEDTIYHLHRALGSGRIDLERFLRTTRVLAEEQFMKRALVEKILHGLPMGMALR